MNFAGDPASVGTLRRRDDHRRAAALAARRTRRCARRRGRLNARRAARSNSAYRNFQSLLYARRHAPPVPGAVPPRPRLRAAGRRARRRLRNTRRSRQRRRRHPGCSATPAAAAAKPAAATSPVAPAVVPATATSPGSRPATATAPATPAATPAPGQPRPFADVIKDATETPGLFRSGRRTTRSGSRSRPSSSTSLFLSRSNLARGIGENRVYGGMMAADAHIGVDVPQGRHQRPADRAQHEVHRQGGHARGARGRARRFSDSLLAQRRRSSRSRTRSASRCWSRPTRCSSPTCRRRRTRLERPTGSRYAFDARNSSFEARRTRRMTASRRWSPRTTRCRAGDAAARAGGRAGSQSAIRRRHAARHRAACSSASTTASPSCPTSRCGRAPPTTAHRLLRRPTLCDYSDDRRRTARRQLRASAGAWRRRTRRRRCPSRSSRSCYWLDRNVPEKYRGAIRDGILEWNKAFERIGFKDAIRVEIQPDDADLDDVRRAAIASIRWMTPARRRVRRIGPSVDRSAHRRDPRRRHRHRRRLGVRAIRQLARRDLHRRAWPAFDATKRALGRDPRACTYATDGAGRSRVRARPARGARRDDARRPRRRGVRAGEPQGRDDARGRPHARPARTTSARRPSTPQAQLADPEFTRANGIAGSVMEYNAGQHRAARRAAGRVPPCRRSAPTTTGRSSTAYARARAGDRGAGARAHRRARLDRAAARVHVRRRDVRCRRSTRRSNSFDLGDDPLAYARAAPEARRASCGRGSRARQLEAGTSRTTPCAATSTRGLRRGSAQRRSTRPSTSAAVTLRSATTRARGRDAARLR